MTMMIIDGSLTQPELEKIVWVRVDGLKDVLKLGTESTPTLQQPTLRPISLYRTLNPHRTFQNIEIHISSHATATLLKKKQEKETAVKNCNRITRLFFERTEGLEG